MAETDLEKFVEAQGRSEKIKEVRKMIELKKLAMESEEIKSLKM